MHIKNCTPHEVSLIRADGTVLKLPKSPNPARVAMKTEVVGDIEGVPMFRATYGVPENVPAPEADTLFVVSAMVRAVCPGAHLCSPGELVRDAEGNVIGARGLIFT